MEQKNPTTTTSTTLTLKDLPLDVLVRIVSMLDTADDHNNLFSSHSSFSQAVSMSKSDCLFLYPGLRDPLSWSRSLSPYTKTFSQEMVYFPSQNDMAALFHALEHAVLYKISMHYVTTDVLMLLQTQTSTIRTLFLSVKTAALYNLLLRVLEASPYLTHLGLLFKLDFSQVHLPFARRCACSQLRLNPESISNTLKSELTTFELSCECMASSNLIVPPFPSLKHLVLGGKHIGECEPNARFYELVKSLDTIKLVDVRSGPLFTLLTAWHHNISNVVKKRRNMSLPITGLEINTKTRLSGLQLRKLFQVCPNLSSLKCTLHFDSEREIPSHSNLTDLRIAFETREGTERFHPLSPGVLSRLSGLNSLHITSATWDENELKQFLQQEGEKLESLSIPVHGGTEPSFEAMVNVLDWVVIYCTTTDQNRQCETQLKELAFQRVRNNRFKPCSYVGPFSAHPLSRAYQRFRRLMPSVKFESVRDAVHDFAFFYDRMLKD